MWVLILILQVDMGDYRGGTSITTQQVGNYQSSDACGDAGRKFVKERANGPIKRLVADWSCVEIRTL